MRGTSHMGSHPHWAAGRFSEIRELTARTLGPLKLRDAQAAQEAFSPCSAPLHPAYSLAYSLGYLVLIQST